MYVEQGLYNCSCRDFLANYDKKFIDLVITSPPYNVGIQYDNYNDNQDYKQYLRFIHQTFADIILRMKDNSVLCVNIGKDYAINTPAHYAQILEEIGYNFYCRIIWRKPVGSAVPSAMCQQGFPKYLPYSVTEDILVYTKGVMPKKLAYNLLMFFSKEGDLVFDPFAGIGTTLLIAKENHRYYVGTEISKKYCEIFYNMDKQELLL